MSLKEYCRRCGTWPPDDHEADCPALDEPGYAGPDAEGLFTHTITVKAYGDAAVVYFAEEAKRVTRWTRAAEAEGLTLPEWLARCAERELLDDEPDSVRPGPGDEP